MKMKIIWTVKVRHKLPFYCKHSQSEEARGVLATSLGYVLYGARSYKHSTDWKSIIPNAWSQDLLIAVRKLRMRTKIFKSTPNKSVTERELDFLFCPERVSVCLFY